MVGGGGDVVDDPDDAMWKTAITVRDCVARTAQLPSPEQAPAQWSKTEEAVSCGVSATRPRDRNPKRHLCGHAMPSGELLTVPGPTTTTVTVKRCFDGAVDA